MVSIVKNGKAVELKAISGKVSLNSGDKIVISDGVSGQSTQKLITKKVGKDLAIFEEGAGEASAVLEEYYNTPMVQLEGVEGNLYIANENQEGFELLTGSLDAPAAGEAVAVASAVGGGTTATAGLSTMNMVGLGGVGVAGGVVAYKQLKVIPETTAPDTTAPTITSGSTSTDKDENSGAGQLIYTATATDTSAITYSLKNTGDSNLLTINSTTGAVTLIDNPDFETKNSYNFTVIATDIANNASEKEVTFAIVNFDEVAPTITSTTTATTINENTGAGKSTLLRLLAGFYKPTEGKVIIGGFDISHISGHRLRQEIGYLPQDTKLFSGTMRDNLTLGLNGIADEDILKACSITGLIRYIDIHTNGLDASICEGRNVISSGQRQLIALTRLIIASPSVWLLDEPTANLDDRSEQTLMYQLRNTIKSEDTMIVVTHNPQMLSLVNRIIVLGDSGVVMDGPKDEILCSKEWYS